MTQNDMPTSAVLNRAADLIEERGWATGNCGMALTGPTCLEGAIAAVLQTETDVYAFTRVSEGDLDRGQEFYAYTAELHNSAAYLAVAAHLNRPKESLYIWNDEQAKAEQVIATLRAAAVIEQARESKVEVTA